MLRLVGLFELELLLRQVREEGLSMGFVVLSGVVLELVDFEVERLEEL